MRSPVFVPEHGLDVVRPFKVVHQSRVASRSLVWEETFHHADRDLFNNEQIETFHSTRPVQFLLTFPAQSPKCPSDGEMFDLSSSVLTVTSQFYIIKH